MPPWKDGGSRLEAEKFKVGRSDFSYAVAVAILIILGAFFYGGGVFAQPYPAFAECGFAAGGFVIVLGWISARSKGLRASKVPKVTARRVPKQ